LNRRCIGMSLRAIEKPLAAVCPDATRAAALHDERRTAVMICRLAVSIRIPVAHASMKNCSFAPQIGLAFDGATACGDRRGEGQARP